MTGVTSTIMVPLDDAVVGLMHAVEEYGLSIAQRYRAAAPQTRFTNYNYGPFVAQLLDEIFTAHPDDTATLGKTLRSTQILIDDGLPPDLATSLAAKVFTSVVDCISTSCPGLTFGTQEGIQYGLCNEYDLAITVLNSQLQKNI